MIKLARYLKYYKKLVTAGPFFKLVEAVFELIVPLVMAAIIDVGVKNGDSGYILKMGFVLVLLGVVGLGCSLICQKSASIASQGVGTRLRDDLFEHINTFSHAEIDKFGTATLTTRLTSDVNQIQLAVAMLIRLVIRAPFLAVGATVMAFFIDVKMALVFVVTTAAVSVTVYIIMSKTLPYFRTLQRKLDVIARITRENISGARIIKAFDSGEREQAKFDSAVGDYTETALRSAKISALLGPITYVIVNLAIVALISFSGGQVEAGKLTQGELIALINYMLQMLTALLVVANLFIIFTKASASAARINEVFDTVPSVGMGELDAAETANSSKNVPAVEFESVYFKYTKSDDADGEKYVLSDISFTLMKGMTMGIIGATGSGKSTLVSLIPRFYDADSGKVSVTGRDVREWENVRQLRASLGIVPQKASLISGTIEENLRWGNPAASDELIWRALDTAQASEIVKGKSDGLKSIVAQGARNLSGGQKQRLTIARALIGEPEILILDDSASALDYATEAALRQSLTEFDGAMTQIIVSQRINSVRHADVILVLDDGKMAGKGTHDELLASCAVYKEIFDSQSASELQSVADLGIDTDFQTVNDTKIAGGDGDE